jgi:hypothetical protein
VIAALMIYAIPVLFKKHLKKVPLQDQFSNANLITFLKRKVRKLSSDKSADVMNAEKIKSKTMLTTITAPIVTTIYAWTVQLLLQKY